MEGSRKRKASAATTTQVEGNGSKRLRLLNTSHAADDSQSNIQKIGYKLVEQLNRASDKTGRPIATQFKSLPSRNDLPDYYDFTKLPIAIDTVERKLQQNAYPTVTALESDLKRMVQNAKDYNTTGSDIFEDAERIRKLVYNYMKVNNPEYSENPQYVSFPTPIPKSGENPNRGFEAATKGKMDTPSNKARDTNKRAISEAEDRKSSIAPSAATGEEGDSHDFTGKTFQEAQQMLVSGLLSHHDEEGLEIYTPFANLPTRKLEDYYKVIRYPVSLKGVAKRVKGLHGRNPPTGITDFKTWDAFEEEVSWIWRNAREYNEDGSEMYNLAGEFEDDFKNRLAEAKAKVDEPSQPKLKLGGPKPKVTLNLSQHRASPTPHGVSVDNEALARQKQLVAAGVNGRQSEKAESPAVNGASRSVSQVAPVEAARPQSSAAGSPPDSVKLEKAATQSPAPNAVLPLGLPNDVSTMMPPPVARPTSGSPLPNGHHLASSYTFTAPALLPPTPLRDYPAADALLPDLTISTHPQLKLASPMSLSMSPHPTLSHQSQTITLPTSHYFLQISPTISRALSMGRPYKMFVTVNGSRLTQRDTIFHQDSGRRTHVYEGTLAPGVNRVEVEVASAKDGDKGLDIEKVTVFANLMKA